MDFLPLEIDGKRVYAGFWKRFWSIWADFLVLLPFALLFAWIEGFNRTLAIVLVVPAAFLFSFYSVYFNARFGGTLGKLAVGIRITRSNGEKIGWKEACLRSSVDLVFASAMAAIALRQLWLVDPLEYINTGFFQRLQLLSLYDSWWYPVVSAGQQVWVWSEVLVLLLNRRKRALHDFIAGTVVVRKEFIGIMARRSFVNADMLNVRRSWLNVALAAVLVGIVALGGSVIVWFSVGMTDHRDYPPPDTSDLVVERRALPDLENAYTYFLAATNLLCWPTDASLTGDVCKKLLDGGRDEAHDQLIRDLIAGNDDTIEIIRDGLACRICQAPAAGSIDDPLPSWGEWRNIAWVMALKARSERLEGQYAQSMQSCMELLKYGGMIQANAETISQYLVGAAIVEMGLEQSRQFAGAPGVAESLLIKLSGQIGQFDVFDRGLIRSFKTEYKTYAKLLDDLNEGKFNLNKTAGARRQRSGLKRLPSLLFQPNKTKYLMANHFRILINNASLPYNKGKPVVSTNDELNVEGKSKLSLMVSGNVIGKMLAGMILPNLNDLVERKCKTECSSAATRLILACRAYQTGLHALPDGLEALVPKYIASIPSDPYDGQSFKYSKSKAIVYSVGKDLKDGGGSTELPADDKSVCDYDKQWKALDIVFKIEEASK